MRQENPGCCKQLNPSCNKSDGRSQPVNPPRVNKHDTFCSACASEAARGDCGLCGSTARDDKHPDQSLPHPLTISLTPTEEPPLTPAPAEPRTCGWPEAAPGTREAALASVTFATLPPCDPDTAPLPRPLPAPPPPLPQNGPDPPACAGRAGAETPRVPGALPHRPPGALPASPPFPAARITPLRNQHPAHSRTYHRTWCSP